MSITAARACSMLESMGLDPLYSHRNYLNRAKLLPVTGRGKTTALLNSQHLTSLVIGCAAGRAVDAGWQGFTTRDLVCEATGKTLGEAIKAIFDAEPADIDVDQLGIAKDGMFAWIRRTSSEKEIYGEPRSACRATIFSTGCLSALCVKLHFSTQSGWVGEQ